MLTCLQTVVEKNTPGDTIIPIILSSDKTQVMIFGNKNAYPLYLIIRNLPKEICRKPLWHGQILVRYLPTTHLMHIKSVSLYWRVLVNLFHVCMTRITELLEQAGMLVVSGNGVAWRGHHIFANYVGDYPEQLLVTCIKNGQCPTCKLPHTHLGDHLDVDYPPCSITEALASRPQGSTVFAKKCCKAEIKP